MKKFLIIVLLFVSASAFGQISMAWNDSLHVTTAAVDTTFPERWISATLYFDGCDGYITYAFSAADTAGWSNNTGGKEWIKLNEGTPFTITRNKELQIPGLSRLKFYGSGTGTLYITGIKKSYR